MRLVILPVWQIPFDSPYFVPVTLQNSWGSHTAVSLHNTVIFGNVFNKYKQQVIYGLLYEVYFDIQYIKSLTVLTPFSNMIHGTVAIEKSCISYASSPIFTWQYCTRIWSKKMGLNLNMDKGNTGLVIVNLLINRWIIHCRTLPCMHVPLWQYSSDPHSSSEVHVRTKKDYCSYVHKETLFTLIC